MKAVLDTCVLFPPILREILIETARNGGFAPVWSDEILTEWQHVAARDGAQNAQLVAAEIARLSLHFPDALVAFDKADTADLYLPDPHDLHVLAAARKAQAALIVTANLRDFPKRELAHLGVEALHPDAFLRGLWQGDAALIERAVADVLAQARALSGHQMSLRDLLKRARLPRLAKALARP